MHQLNLSFFGIAVSVTSTSKEIVEWLTFDFARFITTAAVPGVSVTIDTATKPAIPEMVEQSHAPEYILYRDKAVRWIDYYGRALCRFQPDTNSAVFYGDDEPFLYEKIYLYILSRIGELLDTRGVHRVHALGFTSNNKGALYLIPMRGGKSTLGLRLRSTQGVKILSDDTPVIDSRGNLYPFPMRLGVLAGEVPSDIAPPYIRRFERAGKDPKDLIHPDGIKDFWHQGPIPCSAIIVGRWTTAAKPSIKMISRAAAYKLLLRDCVIGYGLPQVVEFFLRFSPSDIAAKCGLVLRRMWAAGKLVTRSRCLEIHMTPDHEANIRLLLSSLEQLQRSP